MPKTHEQTKAGKFDRNWPKEFSSVRTALLVLPEKLLDEVLEAVYAYGGRRAMQREEQIRQTGLPPERPRRG